MSKKSFLKFLFLFLIISFLGFGQFVLACAEGQTRPGNPCGTQTCDQDCRQEIIDFGIEIMIITVCDWGSCESGGETQNCGTCGVQECQSGSTSCSWSSCDETSKPNTKKTDDWNEYRCQGEGCGNQYIEKREAYQDYTRSVNCLGEGNWKRGAWKKDGDPYYDEPSITKQCDTDWYLCSGSNEWSKSTRSCGCAGTCLEEPQEDPRYYNNPDYPTHIHEPEESEDSNDIFLPVKLYWEDVKWWQLDNGPKSYSIQFNGNTVSGLLEESEFTPESCFLKSGTNYNWKVSPCCGTDKNNCKPWADIDPWNFVTNSAPEPISPADPDWVNPDKGETNLPVSLEWCPVSQAESYRIRAYYFENEEERCHPWFIEEGEECIGRAIKREGGTLDSTFDDSTIGIFTKGNLYHWQVTTCYLSDGSECQDFSQKWKFQISEEYILPAPFLISPGNDEQGKSAVALPVTLEWRGESGVYSFRYEINGVEGKTSQPTLVLNYPGLDLNAFYKWEVQPCWDEKSEECEQDIWSDEWTFKTTGAPPNLISPESGASNVPIPIKLDWEDVSGSKSYKYWVYSGERIITHGITTENSILIKYDPALREPKQETNYSWQVATCIDLKGEICGEKTGLQDFKTFKLSPPSNLLPENNEIIFTYQMPKGFSWNSDAKYFRFILDYIQKSEQEAGDCPLGTEEKITDSSSYLVSLDCLGEYQWQVRACLDEKCDEEGESSIQNFTLDQTIPPAQFGLVPCGRSSDNPDTPWNERESCQIKHLFILLRNIIDFLLWRVTLIVLLLLVIATALIFYFSIGAPTMIIYVKGVWRAAGKGYAIIFISWIIINLVLNILGYQVGIFGQWWQINL